METGADHIINMSVRRYIINTEILPPPTYMLTSRMHTFSTAGVQMISSLHNLPNQKEKPKDKKGAHNILIQLKTMMYCWEKEGIEMVYMCGRGRWRNKLKFSSSTVKCQ